METYTKEKAEEWLKMFPHWQAVGVIVMAGAFGMKRFRKQTGTVLKQMVIVEGSEYLSSPAHGKTRSSPVMIWWSIGCGRLPLAESRGQLFFTGYWSRDTKVERKPRRH